MDSTALRVDANVILRYMTQEPAEQAAGATRLFEAVASGELAIVVEDLTLAEVAWTLRSFYRLERVEIADLLAELVAAEGVIAPDPSIRLALSIYRDHNVKLIDAVLAAKVLGAGESELWSFDRDFDRIPGLRRSEPGAG